MNTRLLSLTSLAGLLATAPPASAYVIFEVTGCDTVSVAEQRFRTTFTAQAFAGVGFSEILVRPWLPSPASTDTTHILDCGAPPGWHCGGMGTEGIAFWSGPGPIEPPGTFSFESDRPVPCVSLIFTNPVENVGWIDACLRCDMPVPAARASWGSMKSRYR